MNKGLIRLRVNGEVREAAVPPSKLPLDVLREELGLTGSKRGRDAWPASIARLDPDHDLCELNSPGLSAPPVLVRASSSLAVGERVYAIGAPEGLELTLSEGVISGLRDYEGGHVIQTSAAVSPGSRGGGLFDTEGRLIGITTFSMKEGQNLNFALPGEWAQALVGH